MPDFMKPDLMKLFIIHHFWYLILALEIPRQKLEHSQCREDSKGM